MVLAARANSIRRVLATIVAIAALPAHLARSQDQPPIPKVTFDVASIKSTGPTGKYWYTVSPVRNGQFTARNITAKELISMAYKIEDYQVSGGPKWLDADRFDVDARAEVPPPGNDLHLQLQTLLADRFQLEIHRTTKEAAAYALVVSGRSAKVQSTEQRDCSSSKKSVSGCGGIRFAGRGLTAEYVSMAALARGLTGILRIPVLDETNVKGTYDFKLEFVDTAEGAPKSDTASVKPAELNVDWIFAALPQQLGLKLKPTKAPIEMVVIDRIEQPSAN